MNYEHEGDRAISSTGDVEAELLAIVAGLATAVPAARIGPKIGVSTLTAVGGVFGVDASA